MPCGGLFADTAVDDVEAEEIKSRGKVMSY